MRIPLPAIVFVLCLAPAGLQAADSTRQEAMRELGAVLAWRLGPETVEETCRSIDPDGNAARKQALEKWHTKNAALIREVDERVDAVVPALVAKPAADVAATVRAQVKTLLVEDTFAAQSDEGKRDICRAEADPASPRWNNSGMPHVQQSLAVLFDWQSATAPASAAESADTAASPLDAWRAAKLMGLGVNIGNTLENTTHWETGWGNPRISREYIARLAALGFKTVRLPVAWDTYAQEGRIPADKLARVGEVVDWVLEAGMFCVVNIHWDGGWIDSSNREKFARTYATFSDEAARKYPAYWQQIANYFADRNERLVFESLNEETHFEQEGSPQKAYETLARVNQLFIDTVRATGGRNAQRLLIVAGYSTDFTKTVDKLYRLPTDSVPHRLLISVHYYTPWPFAGMTEDASWGKMRPTWGNADDLRELNRLFDAMREFCSRHDLPAFVGEFAPTTAKETPSRVRWMTAVAEAALARGMVPVLWETGGDIARKAPFEPSPALRETLRNLAASHPDIHESADSQR